MTGSRLLSVCADDFGLSRGVNDGILDGVQAGWITAVSCMSTAPAWREGAHALLRVAAGRAELGLHLNLTEALPDEPGAHSLRSLILRACTGRLDRAELNARVVAQLDAFEQATGQAPEYVDGHQHVHQLPVVREVLTQELLRRYAARLPWLRDTAYPSYPRLDGAGRKHVLIALLGAHGLRKLAEDRGFMQNRGMIGVYGFDAGESSYLQLLQRWLDDAEHRTLLMCHPGLGDLRGDPIAVARRREHAVLSGPEFPLLLMRRGFRIGRMGMPMRQAA